jgi:ATP-dependent DNA ligase
MTKMIVFQGWDAQIGRPKNDCCHPKNNRCLGRLSKAQGKPLLQLPSGSQWLHEIKHDGFRIIARKSDGKVRLKASASLF